MTDNINRGQFLAAGGMGLAALVSQLQQRVAALERRPTTASESVQPNIFQVGANGQTSVVFPGGVQMHERAGAGYLANSALGWLDSAGSGAIREFIVGEFLGGFHILSLNALPGPAATDFAQALLRSTQAGGAGSSDITLTARDTTTGVTQTVTALRSDAASSFLQLLVTAQVAITFGTATLTWPGAAPTSNAATVAHGLGRVPQWYGAFDNGTAAGGLQFYMHSSGTAADGTNLNLQGTTITLNNVAAGTTGAFLWVAVG